MGIELKDRDGSDYNVPDSSDITRMAKNNVKDILTDTKSDENMGKYEIMEKDEKEKFDLMKDKFVKLIKIMDDIADDSSKADELGIRVIRSFPFFEIYENCGFGHTGKKINFNYLFDTFSSFRDNLQLTIENGVKLPGKVKNMSEYVKEHFNYMKKNLNLIVKSMNSIEKYLKKSNELGISVERDFTFDEIYRTGGFQDKDGSVDLYDLSDKFIKYSVKLEEEVREKQLSDSRVDIESIKSKILELTASISSMDDVIKTPEQWKELIRKLAILDKYNKHLFHLTHSDEEIKQIEIASIESVINNLETSTGYMRPQTPEEWKDYDNKVALLEEYRKKLQHLIHSDE